LAFEEFRENENILELPSWFSTIGGDKKNYYLDCPNDNLPAGRQVQKV